MVSGVKKEGISSKMVNTETELVELKRGKKTSINIDVDIWHEIRKTAIWI
jgi:hypothetical protein